MDAADRRPSRADRWSLRVAVWLLALAVVPLSGATWFAFSEVSRVGDARTTVEAVVASTEELAGITELHARILDERNWSAAESTLSELGIDVAMVEALIGTDIRGLLEESRSHVDRLVGEVTIVGLTERLEEARASSGRPFDGVDEYASVAEVVEDRSHQVFTDLFRSAANVDQGDELIDALRVLDASATARRSITVQLTYYFTARLLPGSLGQNGFQVLAEARPSYDEAVAVVERVAHEDARAASVVSELHESQDVRRFSESVDRLLLEQPAFEGSTLDLTALIGQLDELTAEFQAATGAVDEHIRLLQAARDDTTDVSEHLVQNASTSTRKALFRIAVVGIGSLLFAVGLARAIGRPLSDLAAGARKLQAGAPLPTMRSSGPREVREAITALDEAAGHIELAQRQARALAAGEMGHPALQEDAPGALGESLQDAVRTLAASLTAREDLETRLIHEASHDALTGLANRSAALQHLSDQLGDTSSSRLLAVAFIDLDGFKLINDRYGHPGGDEVLTIVARRLARAVAPTDVVGRLGGDEFLVITSDHEDLASLVACAQEIIDAVGEPIRLSTSTVQVRASIGIAIAGDAGGNTVDELLANADVAVYKAKERGRGGIEVCDERLRAEVASRKAIEAALRSALAEGDFELHFQPVFRADGGKVSVVEALLRWSRPDLGVHSPGDFIPIAERSELILDVDRAVMYRAAAHLHAWSSDPALADVQISVNISAGHLRSHTFVQDMLSPLTDHGVDPSRVIIEVTESALVDDVDCAAQKLDQLRRSGIEVAIDDFGTGYTSLGQLRRLPVDLLKIDRSFVEDCSATNLVELIISIGHVLGARVVAEGIETDEQAERMVRLGADELQGFLLARPMTASALSDAMRTAVASAAVVAGA